MLPLPRLTEKKGENYLDRTAQLKKILVLGIAESGKTSIVNTIRDRSPRNAVNMLPTRGRSYLHLALDGNKFVVWELAGNITQRNRWLQEKFCFLEASEVIYVIDIQDLYSLTEALDYLSEVVALLTSEEVRKSLEEGFRFTILFHKADPEVVDTPEFTRNVSYSRRVIKEMCIPFDYEIYMTSIRNFKRECLNAVFAVSEYLSCCLKQCF